MLDAGIFAFILLTGLMITSWQFGWGLGFLTCLILTQVLSHFYQKFVVGKLAVPQKAAVLITGCSSGLGFDAAVHLAKKGFMILPTFRKLEDSEPLLAACKGCKVKPIIMDVANADQIDIAKRDVEYYLEKEGLSLLGLINNAGYPESSVLELIDLNSLRKQFEVNVIGQVAVTQAFLPLLRKSTIKNYTPRIIFVGSSLGRMTLPAMGAYSASKHALESVGDAFRMELQSWNIDVIVLEPGSIRTNFNKVSKEHIKENMNQTASKEKDRYKVMCETMLKKQIVMEKLNSGTDVTNAAFESALLDRNPQPRYRPGNDAQFGMPIIIHLPERITDFVFARFFK